MTQAKEVYHGIRLAGRKSRYSAWFDQSGFVLDCERIDARNRCYPCNAQELAAIQCGGWSAKQRSKFA
jgi:hypothetical protein